MGEAEGRLERPEQAWAPASGWAGMARAGRFGRGGGEPGVTLEPLQGFALATLVVRSGQEERLAGVLRDVFGLDLPAAGKASCGDAGDIVWSAPGQWLMVAPAPGSLDALPARLAGVAAVTDQGHARALVRIGGPRVREALAKGIAIDLHPSVFGAGSAAVTAVAHVGVQIWQREAAPGYVVAAPRSFAEGVWSWLTASSAEYGYQVA